MNKFFFFVVFCLGTILAYVACISRIMIALQKITSFIFNSTTIFIIGSSCASNQPETHSFYGKYKMFSDNPSVNQFIVNEDNYIQVNKDKTIIYNSTINSKPKFNFKGEYSYDKEANTLTIKWSEGKLPEKIKIEKEGNDQIIRIGSSFYKKEKVD